MSETSEITVGGYVTAYIDLLGLGNQLARLDEFKNASVTEASGLPLLQESIGRILALRTMLTNYYSQMQPPSPDDPRMEGLTTEQARAYRESLTHNTKIRWFSDCCTISVPFKPDAVEQLLNGTLRLCYGLSFISLGMLAGGQPIRGGMDIGYGVELEKDEVLGSSLAKAYALEQRAQWPRVAIGADLVQLVQEPVERIADATKQGAVAGMRRMIQSMFSPPGADGIVFLDFLGREFRDRIASLPDREELLSKASATIRAALSNPQIASSEKLRAKYEWLRAYFEKNGCWSPTDGS